jgi:16S rRNA C967 or C1407 C5-methylase (RsmB/RsmF family)
LSNDQGLSARRAALELFRAALSRRGGADEALGHGPFAGLELRERAFARALAMTVLRRRGQIERLIEGRLQKPTPDAVRDLLRLGVAQLFFMDVASHAAVSTTVELAQERRETRAFKGLINAVLRGMGRDGPPADDPEALAPAWLFARWRAAFGATVTALDRTEARLKRLAQNFERIGLTAETVVADAARWSDTRRFQAVLLDAPCTSTGAFRRHPDALWATQPPDIAKLAQVQARLLDAAAERLEPGGRLVYCNCSLEPEEGEAQVEAVLLRRKDLKLDPIRSGEGGAPEASLTPRGTLRILPHHLAGGTDGFFAARFVALPGEGGAG